MPANSDMQMGKPAALCASKPKHTQTVSKPARLVTLELDT